MERTFAHVCETGGGRRSWLREVENVSKRHLMQAAHNLGIVMRKRFQVWTPRSLEGAGGVPERPATRDLAAESRATERTTPGTATMRDWPHSFASLGDTARVDEQSIALLLFCSFRSRLAC